MDLGHNFALAHQKWNAAKNDRLGAEEHVVAWAERNEEHGHVLGTEFDRLLVPHKQTSTQRIALWAHERLATSAA